MRRIIRGHLSRTVLLALAVLALVGGVATATIPGSGGVISGCYEKSTGVLRVINTGIRSARCHKNEKPISWSAQGPTGPRGHQGSQGTSGIQGPPGTNGSDGTNASVVGYSNSHVNPIDFTSTSLATEFVAVTIPAGSYFITAKSVLTATATDGADFIDASCELDQQGGTGDDHSEFSTTLGTVGAGDYYSSGTVSMQLPVTETSSTTWFVSCVLNGNTGSPDIKAAYTRIEALTLGASH